MTTQAAKPRANTFVTSALPWVLGAVMFAVYLATLYRWTTPNAFNLGALVDLAGWSSGAHTLAPVTYLVTYPLRWLPPGLMPVALNLFTAICAGLTLVLLGRSVALLPHDRTHDQRQREQSEYSVLTIGAAWAPPVLAVLLCGLEMTFWESSIQWTGEVFDLLLFAYIIRCLLEYRITQKESWMGKFAFVYGLALANNWAMMGFIPLFLVAVVWTKGLGFFEARFLLRSAGLLLAGFSLFFLFPLMSSFSHGIHASAWQVIRTTLSTDKRVLSSFPRDIVLLLSLTSVLPVFVIGIRWASYFGDNSPLGIFMATSIFHIVHALFLLACIWVAWDAPISPRNKGFGYAFLPFYYLGAISIGYCTGYFLLIFGGRTPKYQHSMNPLLRVINVCVTSLIYVLLIGAPLVIILKNLPAILRAKVVTHAYEQYFTQIEQLLPAQGAVVLSDDNFRTDYLHATLLRDGKNSPHLLIDTSALINDPNYTGFLKSRNPQYRLPAVSFKPGEQLDAGTTINYLDMLGKTHELYYTHPSFGFFFERFYLEPQGLVYRLKDYPTNVWDAPVADKEQIAQNQDFWKKTSDNVLPPLTAIMAQPLFPEHPGLWDKFMDLVHLKAEPDWAALPLGGFYSHALDFWGVELQRVNQLADAGKCFVQAEDLSPRNISTRVNAAFNENLRAGTQKIILLPKEMREKYSRPSGWQELLNSDGPIDEPDFRDGLTEILAKAGQYRQAVQQLDRIKELLPNAPIPCGQLAVLLEHIQTAPNELGVYLPDSATCHSGVIANADEAMKAKPNDPTMLFLKSVAFIQLKEYEQALPVLNTLLSVQTNNYAALLNRAIAYYKVGNLDAAKPDYEAVRNVAPKAFQVYYGLAEIAYRQKDFPAAITNYELYLTNAPSNSAEASSVIARLKVSKAARIEPMRVTHVITRLIVGGAQENTIASVLGLRSKPDMEVSLLSGPETGPEGSLLNAFAKTPEKDHKTPHNLSNRPFFSLSPSGGEGWGEGEPPSLILLPELVRAVNPWKDLLAWRRLIRLFRQLLPDIVHTHSGKAGVLGRLAAHKAGVPVIVHTIHGPSFGPFQGPLANAAFLSAEKRAAKVTTHFVAVADAMIRQYLAAGIGTPEKYTKILSGFSLPPFLSATNDPAIRARHGLEPEDIVIGKIARLFKLKGHEDLFRVAPDLVRACPRIKFLLVGDGPWRGRFEQLAATLGLKKHFIFTGLIPPAEIPSLVGIMDVLAHLSLREGLARALPQAMAAARPVVAYDCDGANEVVRDNETGFLMRPGDLEGLRERLSRLAGDAALRERLGQRGRETVRESFAVEKMVDDLFALYLKLAPASRMRPL